MEINGIAHVILTVGNFAAGEPMVHIRAIPEGGTAGSAPPTNLPYTFYDRYTPQGNRKMDRRVPLPSMFAARWIEGGAEAHPVRETLIAGNVFALLPRIIALSTEAERCSGQARAPYAIVDGLRVTAG